MPKSSKYDLNGNQHRCKINEKSRLRFWNVLEAFLGAKSEPKGTKREPMGAEGEPKVSQGATKMHQKNDLRKRSRKRGAKDGFPKVLLDQGGDHFRPKIEKMASKKTCKNWCRKSIEKSWTKHPKWCQNGCQNQRFCLRKADFSKIVVLLSELLAFWRLEGCENWRRI